MPAFQALLEIDGVKGESTHKMGKDQIELLSYSNGESMPMERTNSNTSRASGRADHKDFTISKLLDLSSPTLYEKCCTGEEIKSIKLHVFKADAKGAPLEFVTYVFENCLITSISMSGSTDGQPTESVSFNYLTVKWTYNQQEAAKGGKKGKSEGGWSVKENKKL
jgi:type VI secretion system secreted protein Hcp